ncbi:transcriptional regulator, LysR family protein [Oceanicaulis alexandrii HTCC2633]|uniref:LysR family transcriptional regulator n=1 Tax=Oceanicaulis sp. HTCC2633 TaxID=314254 RepID=UPI0000668AB8|nr:LysR family transcriptional regulator [Oceanicaulis sp. HTCC2633]EAP90291.1 transcriptional regulator, LysR family protein [Oceanicaulis alexandrii HTCC2633] [Oceanicaulis sp. HTCC2633]
MAGLAPLNALRAFEAAARQGGFVGAAEELNVTPAAVGQQVRQLEALIGEALFERQGKTLILTERGAAALEPLRRGFELMGEASAALRAVQATPTLTLAADHDVMIAWLGRDLASTDAAIRLVARGEETELTLTRSSVATAPAGADRIMDEVLTPLARPGLVAPDAGLAVLETLPLIEDSASGLSWAQWLSARGGYGLEAQPRLRAADSLAALALAEEGAGIVLGRKPLAYDAIRAGRLAPVFADGDQPTDQAYFLQGVAGRSPSAAATRLAQHLKACAAARQDLAGEL